MALPIPVSKAANPQHDAMVINHDIAKIMQADRKLDIYALGLMNSEKS